MRTGLGRNTHITQEKHLRGLLCRELLKEEFKKSLEARYRPVADMDVCEEEPYWIRLLNRECSDWWL